MSFEFCWVLFFLYQIRLLSVALFCCAVLCLLLSRVDPVNCSTPGSSVYQGSPGKNTGVGCHVLLQGIFPTQGLNPGLPHCRQDSHQGSSWILEWLSYPFSRGSSHPRNWTRVSCIADGFFTSWATREAHYFVNTV